MKKLLLILLCLPLLFNSCKKDDGQEPYVEPSSLTTQILIEVDGFENLDGNLAIAINNSSESTIKYYSLFETNVVLDRKIDYTPPIKRILANKCVLFINVWHITRVFL